MKIVATLNSSVRLVVFKFLINSNLVPDVIPRLPVKSSGVMPTVSGKKVLSSTPNVYLTKLLGDLFFPKGDYEWRGARVAGERVTKAKMVRGKMTEVKMSDVRFTFCHRQHLDQTPPHHDFVEKRAQIFNFLTQTVSDNLWSVEGYLNPYLNENGSAENGNVLMLCCAGRRLAINPDGTDVEIFGGGHDELGRGIGPRTPLLETAGEIFLSEKQVLYSSVR